MNLRPGTSSDLKKVLGMTQELYKYYNSLDEIYPLTQDDEPTRALFKLHLDEGNYLLCEEDGAVVGFLKGMVKTSTHMGYVEHLYVDPAFRGHGFAKALLNRFRDDCKKVGVKRLHLASDMRSDAYSFWLKMGFKSFASRMDLLI